MINKEDESMLLALRAAEACLKNMYGHLVYLSEKNIVFALAGKVMTDEDKSIIADSLLRLLCDHDIEEFPSSTDILAAYPKENREPDLSNFVGVQSYLVFYHLKMINLDSLFWLTLDPKEWEMDPNYIMFQKFVTTLECVNDTAER